MKKILLSILAVAGALSMTSCKDFLETNSESKFTPSTVYNSLNFTNKAILGIYSNFGHDRMYAQTLSVSNFNGSDTELQKFSIGDPAGGGTVRPMGNYIDNPSTSYNKDIWQRLYTVIEYANEAIEGIEASPLYTAGGSSGATMKAYRAEAKVIRAWCYMELVRNYGGVPFRTIPSTNPNSEMYLDKTDPMEIYAWLVEDLGPITENEELSWTPAGGTMERAALGFTKGLRARLAMYRGGYYYTTDNTWVRLTDWADYYQIAKDECQGIMDNDTHNLNPSFENVFYNQCQLNKAPYGESLFEFGMGLGFTSEIGHLTGVPYSAAPNSSYGFIGGGNSIQTVAPVTLLYSYKRGDLRRDVSVAYYNYNGSAKMVVKTNPLDFSIAKWTAKNFASGYKALKEAAGTSKVTTGINFVAMRYSDVLLMFAEADNALNGVTPEAKDALYQVRNRAYGGSLSTGAFDAHLATFADFQAAIEDERMWEFAGEGIRKYDLIRWGKLAQKLAEMKANIVKIVSDKVNPYDNDAPLPSFLAIKYRADDPNELDLTASTFYDLNEQDDGTGKLIANPPAGYASSEWLKLADNLPQYIDEVVEGMVDGQGNMVNNGRPWRPIHSSIISDSKGKLKNDYGY